MNLLVTGPGVNASSLDDALSEHALDVRNFVVYGHFGVHRVITLYALSRTFGVLRKTRKTCFDDASALLVITNIGGSVTPESKKLVSDALARGIAIFEYCVDYKPYRELAQAFIESHDSSELEHSEGRDGCSEEHSEGRDDVFLEPEVVAADVGHERGALVAERKTLKVWQVSARTPRPIARYDSDEELTRPVRRAGSREASEERAAAPVSALAAVTLSDVDRSDSDFDSDSDSDEE